MNLAQLNDLDADDFVVALAGIYEHSPWVPKAVLDQRPFADSAALAAALASAVADSGADAQLALIRAHPELGARLRVRESLTAASSAEQQGAGLDQCSAEEYAQLQALNSAYQLRFGFPFILAVRGHDRQSIIAAMGERLRNHERAERGEALRQIDRIAGFRLADLLG